MKIIILPRLDGHPALRNAYIAALAPDFDADCFIIRTIVRALKYLQKPLTGIESPFINFVFSSGRAKTYVGAFMKHLSLFLTAFVLGVNLATPLPADDIRTPETAALEANFATGMASMFAERCQQLSINKNAQRIFWLRHEQELIQLGDSDASWRTVRFSASDYDSLNAEFSEKHGFSDQTSLSEFCLAGETERETHSTVGSLLEAAN